MKRPFDQDVGSVAYISPSWPSTKTSNGIVSYIETVVKGLDAIGVKCCVATSKIADDQPTAHPPVFHLQELRQPLTTRLIESVRGRLFSDSSSDRWIRLQAKNLNFGLAKLGLDFPIDIIEMEESFGLAKWVDQTRSPVVIRLHGPWWAASGTESSWNAEMNLRRITLEGELFKTDPFLTCPSQVILDGTRNYYDCPLSNAIVIPNPAPVLPNGLRWKTEARDPNLILYVGRFDVRKGADIMIDAFNKLAQKRPEVKLTIAGFDRGLPVPGVGELKFNDYIARMVPSQNIRSRITFLGRVHPDDLLPLRQRASVVVMASRYETMPMAALEAGALGCPFIAPSLDCLKELVTDGENALLFESGDSDSLVQSVLRLIDSPEEAAVLGANFSRHIALNYSSQSVAQRTKDYYTEVLNRTRANL